MTAIDVTDRRDGEQPPVLVEHRDKVMVLTLNRPRVHNAIDSAMSNAVGAALSAAVAARDRVRAIVVTGAGPTFSAGADLKELANGQPIGPDSNVDWGFAGIARHWVPQPVIAAVNGPALGGGFEIALACDLVVATSSASFGLPEVTRGRLAGAGGLLRLPRQLPFRIALEMAMTGRIMTADEAARWGVINEIVPGDDAVPRAVELAELIAANAPLAVQGSKRIIHGGLDRPLGPVGAWDLSEEVAARVRESRDALEGAQAFLEKRPPAWEGR